MRRLADIMTTGLTTFTPDTSIHEAIRTLLDKRYSGAPVVDAEGELVGVLTRKDCLRIVFSTSYHQDWGGKVREYMHSPVETLDADTDLVSAAQIFLDSHYRRFPVMRDGRLVGQVSRGDLLRALTEV